MIESQCSIRKRNALQSHNFRQLQKVKNVIDPEEIYNQTKNECEKVLKA